jgi:hypothetical protein
LKKIAAMVKKAWQGDQDAPMRILICSNLFPPHVMGGAEMVAYRHAKVLQEWGQDVRIFVDETVCRQYAHQQMGLAPGQVATQHAASGAAVGAAIGAEMGAVIGPVTLSSTSAAPAHVAQVLQNPRIS